MQRTPLQAPRPLLSSPMGNSGPTQEIFCLGSKQILRVHEGAWSPAHVSGAAAQIRHLPQSFSFCFYFKGKKKTKQCKNPVSSVSHAHPPPLGHLPGWGPDSSSHSAAPPLSCNPQGPGGSTSLECQIPGGLAGRKELGGRPLIRPPPPRSPAMAPGTPLGSQ